MTHEQFGTHSEKLLASCLNLLCKKALDYAQGEDDRLINFKNVGRTLDLSPQQVLMVYTSKHLDSINQAIKSNPFQPHTTTEPLTERIKDVINYMVLLDALNEECMPTHKMIGSTLEQSSDPTGRHTS